MVKALEKTNTKGSGFPHFVKKYQSVKVNTTRNWAHLTSKHPQSPQKMGEGDYGRIPKGFCPL